MAKAPAEVRSRSVSMRGRFMASGTASSTRAATTPTRSRSVSQLWRKFAAEGK
jgi:hypothetical protein